jgi:phosphatidate cytidylyltransferase
VLKQRLITATILIPLVIWSVYFLPTYTLSLVFAAILAAGAWEWAALAGLVSISTRIFYVLAIIICLVLSSWTILVPVGLYIVMGTALTWWTGALIWIQQYSRQFLRREVEGEVNPVAESTRLNWNFVLVGILVFIPPWVAFVVIHDEGMNGPYWVMFILVLIWGADSGAYFAGRRWGSRKLAPHVSPGKTWEGVLGACSVTILLAIVGGIILDIPDFKLVPFILLCLLTTLFSVVGDLFESMLKRQAGVKDSGNVLPGHGGILDRIDSLVAGLPVFVLGLLLQGLVS